MNTHISGDFYLGRDRYNWILRERYEAKDRDGNAKGEAYRDISYHASLSQLADKVANMKVKAEAAENVNALIRAVQKLSAAILDRLEAA